jgi:hypothetical protein
MKRSDYTGFTIKMFDYTTEFVLCKYILKTIAIYGNKNRRLIKRWE